MNLAYLQSPFISTTSVFPLKNWKTTQKPAQKKKNEIFFKKMRAAAAPSAEIYRIERRKKNGS